jgi:hypothetical protein
MKLIISIVPKDITEEVSQVLGSGIIDYQTAFVAKGTASSEILEYFSLGETERNVLFSLADDQEIPEIFRKLAEEHDFLKSGMGVAFTVSIDSISKRVYDLFYQSKGEELLNGKQ